MMNVMMDIGISVAILVVFLVVFLIAVFWGYLVVLGFVELYRILDRDGDDRGKNGHT